MNPKPLILILVVYGVISAIGLHYHELFLDEAHHYLVSRDSLSFSDFYNNLRYDGHPRLWGALLYFITHFLTIDPVAMQVLQWLFAMAGAFVLLRYGPFPIWMKVLMISGYYFLFEYSVLSRNYAIGIWMLFLCCHLLRGMEKNAVRIGVLILLMCSAHVFFAFASIGIFLYALASGLKGKPLLLLAIFVGVGLASAVVQAQIPAVDNVNMTAVHPAEWLSVKNFRFAAGALVQGWLPVPQVNGGRFWNTGWLNGDHLGPVMPVLLFGALLVFPAVVLRRRVAAMVFNYSVTGLLLLFFVVTQITANRYFGMVYIFFIAALWLAVDGSGRVMGAALVPGGAVIRRVWWAGWVAILVIQVSVGLYAFGEDIRRPFSQSRNTADFLKVHAAGRPVVVDGYTAGPQLCAYLQRRLYYLTLGGEGSFCVWRKENFPSPRLSIEEEFSRNPGLKGMGEFILVSNRNLGGATIGGYQLTTLKSFENSIVGENYFIYRVDRTP